MKKQKKIKNRMIVCLSFSLLLLFCSSHVYAAADLSQEVITPSKMHEWDNGAFVTSKTSGKGEDFSLSVVADTGGFAKENYSVYMYELTRRSLASYDGIRFQFKNSGDLPLKINLIFTVDSDTNVSLADSTFALLESDRQGIHESVSPQYGMLSIPAGFNGTISIPFSQLHTSKGKSIKLKRIQSWGITTVMAQDQTIRYSLGNITFLKNSVSSMKDSYYFITVSGSQQINLPNAGSTIKFYQAKVKNLEGSKVNQKVDFYLDKNLKGASISDDGKLEVTSACTAKEIKIYAKTKNSRNSGVLTTTLVSGGEKRASNVVPNPSDVSNMDGPVLTILNQSITLVRIVSIVVTICLTVIFTNWFSTANTHYNAVKKKHYEIFK